MKRLISQGTVISLCLFAPTTVSAQEPDKQPLVARASQATPSVLIGFGLPDENAHAPDEHLALENYFGGIKAIARFYTDLATL
jgi:acetylornithine deacetylase/succinyl-diaminopimelate desuccinylase-like protein